MASIRQGFFTVSSQVKNEKRKQNAISSNLMSTSNQHTSQQQQNKQQKRTNTAGTPTSYEKQRKEVKSKLHQQISEFNPSSQMSMEQFTKVILNLQEEVKKFCKESTKLTELINSGLQDMLNLRMAKKEREIDAL